MVTGFGYQPLVDLDGGALEFVELEVVVVVRVRGGFKTNNTNK